MLPIILPALSKMENSDQLEALMRTVPSMSKRTFDSSDSRWSNSKKMMDSGFKFWSDNGRLTPFAVGEEVREELRGGNKQ